MSIRPGKLADLVAIKDCAYRAYEKYVARFGGLPAPMVADYEDQITQGTLYVLEEDDTFIGFIVFYQQEDYIHIDNVAVLPEQQGKRHGTRLIEFAENHSRQQGLNKVELFTNDKMTENLSYYPARGYEEFGRWKEDGLNRIFYRKKLD